MHYMLINDGELKKKRLKGFYLTVASLVICVAGFFENNLLYSVLNIGFSALGLFIDPLIPLCINIATFPMSLATSSLISIGLKCVITFPAMFVYIQGKRNENRSKDFLFIVAVCMLVLISFVFGMNARLTTAILQLMTLICYLVATKVYTQNRNLLVVGAFMLAGFYMMCAVLIQIITGSAVTLWGTRLTYSGSVRTLATALAFPIFVFLAKLFLPQERKVSVGNMCLMLVVLATMVALLIATYSRGVLIAVIISAAYLLFSQFRHLNLKQIAVYILFFAAMACFVLNAEIDTKMMFSDISDGSGRLDIWAFFFEKMGSNGLVGYLFGFGPGDILRISDGTLYEGYYSHSVLLDYIFSYGFCGFCLLAYMIFHTLSAAIKSKNAMHVGLLILTVLLYATHGNSTSVQFHILLGLTYSLSMSQIRKNKEIKQKKVENSCEIDSGV